jgi:ABC-type transport system substrate-binding protein
MSLFPSTRTDCLLMNESFKPFADMHVRRAISDAIDRQAIVKSVLFGHGKAANSFMPPQVPFYDASSLGFSYWTMDIADPDELFAFASDPKGGGAQSFFTGYENAKAIALSHQAEDNEDPSSRAQLYSQIQTMTADDAFLAPLYYSPYRYAYRTWAGSPRATSGRRCSTASAPAGSCASGCR